MSLFYHETGMPASAAAYSGSKAGKLGAGVEDRDTGLIKYQITLIKNNS